MQGSGEPHALVVFWPCSGSEQAFPWFPPSLGKQWHKRVSLVLGVRCSGLFVSLLAELWVRAAGLRLQESAFL